MILDTSVLMDIDRGNHPDRVERLNDRGPHAISAATYMEVSTGRYRNDVPADRFTRIKDALTIVPITAAIADTAGELLAARLDDGDRVGINDLYIAATGIHQDQPVVTADTDHFSRIDRVGVVDWGTV